jgi:hypothetical protein
VPPLLRIAPQPGPQTQFLATSADIAQDEMTVGRELICGAPYQVVANAMADDAGVGAAVPALCPAMKSVAVAVPASQPAPPASAP